MELFRRYFIDGIIDSGITVDGGQSCFQEIPLSDHLIIAAMMTVMYAPFLMHMKHTLTAPVPYMRANLLQRCCAYLMIACEILTLGFKMQTGKGIFLLNPCHIAIMLQIILILCRNDSAFARSLHTIWTCWQFGALLALSIPHLDGITNVEIVLYFVQHLLIVPFGAFILARRYSYLQPSLLNHIPAYTSIVFYQVYVMMPVSRLSWVNLNFALCHNPNDISYLYLGSHYFTFMSTLMTVVSYGVRWLMWRIVPHHSIKKQ